MQSNQAKSKRATKPNHVVHIPFAESTYEKALWSCGFWTARAPKDVGLFAPNVDILPGDFFQYDRDGTLRACREEDESYQWLAADAHNERLMTDWAMMAGTLTRSTIRPKVDRLIDLALLVERLTERFHTAGPGELSGLLTPRSSGTVSMTRELPGVGQFAIRTPTPDPEGDPQYQRPLTVFGSLQCLWPRLKEMTISRLREAPTIWPLQAMHAIAGRDSHPIQWSAAQLKDLEHLRGELERFREVWDASGKKELSAAESRLWQAITGRPVSVASLARKSRMSVRQVPVSVDRIRKKLGLRSILTLGKRGYYRPDRSETYVLKDQQID